MKKIHRIIHIIAKSVINYQMMVMTMRSDEQSTNLSNWPRLGSSLSAL